jgi:hypothetical protein
VLARDERLFLAMANPRDKRVIDELEFVTGRRVYPYVAITSTLERTIRAAYDAKDQGERYFADRPPAEALSASASIRWPSAKRRAWSRLGRGRHRRAGGRTAAQD